MVLTQDLGYPTERMEMEYAVSFGREKKRADIVIFDKKGESKCNFYEEMKTAVVFLLNTLRGKFARGRFFFQFSCKSIFVRSENRNAVFFRAQPEIW